MSVRNRTTDTGWRLVGKAADLIDTVHAVDGVAANDCVFAARFTLRSWLGRHDPLARALEILGNAVAVDVRDAPALQFDRRASYPPSRFEGLSWDVDGERTSWMGELWWRHPHPVVRRVPCTTHAVLTEIGQQVQLTVRVYADGGVDGLGGLVGAGQARPAWLSRLAQECRLSAAWGDASPTCLTGRDVQSFVSDVLFADNRDWPVVVLSAVEAGGHAMPPDVLANELLGLARVYYFDTHATSYQLTDLLGGKEYSCFWGAMRVYLPRFSCADDPFDHPLLFPEEILDPASRAELFGELAVGLRETVPLADGIAARRARSVRPRGVTPPLGTPAVQVPDVSMPAAPAPHGDFVATPLPTSVAETNTGAPAGRVDPAMDAIAHAIGTVAVQLEALAGAVSKLAAANRELFDEVAQLRTGNAVRLASISSIERRIERIDAFVLQDIPQLLSPRSASESVLPENPDDERPPLVEIVRQASARHGDALLVLESAETSALDSPYEDVDRVAKVLDAMAELARRRQHGTLGMPVRQAFRDYGIDYRSTISETTPGKQRSQYWVSNDRGQRFECLEHIVLGSTYDPRYCLRIYFTSRAPLEQRFVIGHIGRHFEVITTT
jgi:hypothetical protein